jgi:hypothetical protein
MKKKSVLAPINIIINFIANLLVFNIFIISQKKNIIDEVRNQIIRKKIIYIY